MDLHECAGRMEQTIIRWDRRFIILQIPLDQVLEGGPADRLGLRGTHMGPDSKEQVLVSGLKGSLDGVGSVESWHVQVVSKAPSGPLVQTTPLQGDLFDEMEEYSNASREVLKGPYRARSCLVCTPLETLPCPRT